MIITALLGGQALLTVHSHCHRTRRVKAVCNRLLCLSLISCNIITGTLHGLFTVSDWTRWSATESFSQTQTHTPNSWKEDTPPTAPKSQSLDHCQGNRDTNNQGPDRIDWEYAAQSYTTKLAMSVLQHLIAEATYSSFPQLYL